jgi:hypothetical protein
MIDFIQWFTMLKWATPAASCSRKKHSTFL